MDEGLICSDFPLDGLFIENCKSDCDDDQDDHDMQTAFAINAINSHCKYQKYEV